MQEAFVIKRTIAFLEKHGWTITNKEQPQNRRGVDIKGYRPGGTVCVEAKGDSKYHNQAIHNAFVTAIGQIMFRMDKKQKHCYYGIAIPSSWETKWKKKIRKMRYAWKQLGIRIYLVHSNGHVEWKNWRTMLKEE